MWNDDCSIMKPAYFIIWFSFNINFRFSIRWYSKAQKVIEHNYVKYTCSMETVQQNGRFTLFPSKFNSSIYSILLLIAPLIPKIQQVTLLSFRNGLSVFSSRTWRRRVFMVGASGEPFYQINVNSRILNQGYLL